jgi:regulation of enolase protein 1 (concanavalin A-like superfamily)
MRKRAIAILAIMLACFLTLAFSVGFASASAGFSDEFSASSLSSGWTAVDPTGTSPFDLTSHSGWLRISTNSGPEFNLARTTMTSPRILQTVTGDFEITTKVSGNFAHSTVAAGLVVWKDSSNFFRVERWYDSSDHQQAVHSAGNYQGTWANGAYYSFGSNQDPTYLKITRVGITLTGYWSTDGSTWNQFTQTTFNVADPVSVGLTVINVGGGLFNADFDYFRITPQAVSVLPESPVGALVLSIAVIAAFATYKYKPWLRAKTTAF